MVIIVLMNFINSTTVAKHLSVLPLLIKFIVDKLHGQCSEALISYNYYRLFGLMRKPLTPSKVNLDGQSPPAPKNWVLPVSLKFSKL